MCSSGQEDSSGNPVYEVVKDVTAVNYFIETEPLITYDAASDDSGSALYTITLSDRFGTAYSVMVKGLSAGTYRLADPDGNELTAPVTVSGTNAPALFRVEGVSTDLSFKIQRVEGETVTDLAMSQVSGVTVSKYYEEVVMQDGNGTELRLEYFPKNAETKVVTTDHYGNPIGYEDNKTYTAVNGGFTIPVADAYPVNDTQKKFSVLVKGLDNATYTVSDSDAVVTHRPVGNQKVDLLVTKTVTGEPSAFTFTVVPPEGVNLPESLTAVRCLVSDNNGIVQIPSDVAWAVAENLAYGESQPKTVVKNEVTESKQPGEQFNGLWEKYYYSVVECDRYGLDDHSTLTFAQQEITPASTNDDLLTAKKMTFILDTADYHQPDQSPRKYLNIKIVNTTDGNSIVKRDINGNALKVTIYNNDTASEEPIGEYYASNEENTIPAEGVIVIPIPVYCDSLRCVVEGLPYGVKRSDGSDWASEYSYTVERCKASGKTHNDRLSFGDIVVGETTYLAQPYIEKTTPQHKQANISYTKTWDETADYYHLRPDTVYFRLYRRYEGSEPELVKQFEKTVTADTISDNTAEECPAWLDANEVPLAAGKLVHVDLKGEPIEENQTGMDVWRPYTYYLTEYTDSSYTTVRSTNNQYAASLLYETDKPFVLQNNYLYAELDQGLKNKLQKTKHEVLKEWDDSDDISQSREDYTLVLERKTSESSWEKVDLRDVVVSSVKINESTNVKTFTRVNVSSSAAVNELEVPKDKLRYCFDNLPLYNQKGLEYSYRIIEQKIGSNIVADQTYLSFVPGTLVEDDEYSYVRTIRRGTANYYVDYDEEEQEEYTDKDGVTYSGSPEEGSEYQAETYGECIIRNQINTDSVSFSNYTATKIWNDEDNLYGVRPDSITYTLKRTKTINGETFETDFSSPKTVTAADNWTAEWKQCAAKAPDGGQFEYYVEESTVNYYTSADVSEELENTKKYTFTNTYVPEKRRITAYKVWDDQDDRFSTRPATVRYQLWCSYQRYENVTNNDIVTAQPILDEYNSPVYYNGLVYDPEKGLDQQSAVYRAMAAFDPTLTGEKAAKYFEKVLDETMKAGQTGTDKNTWKVEFDNLPQMVNGLADGVWAGKNVPVTYFIKEVFDDDTTATLYQCPDKKDSMTSEELFLLRYGKPFDGAANELTADSTNGTFSVPAI